jgi:hypothetical protein
MPRELWRTSCSCWRYLQLADPSKIGKETTNLRSLKKKVACICAHSGKAVKDKMITVDEVQLPMQNINYLQGSSTLRALKLNHSLAMEPHSTQDVTKRVTRILDAKYKKADLQLIVRDNCKHLSADQQKKLLQLLKKYELLFDSTLGDWKTKPVSFQLKEGVSPYHGRAFPVPKIHKDTIIKEVERLCKLGVLERQHASKWALPSFFIPKKDRTVHF